MSRFYPAQLVPKADYLIFKQVEVLTGGALLRALPRPAWVSLDATGKIDADVFSLPQRSHLVQHCSVNLLGIYQTDDAAWDFSGLNKQALTTDWCPGKDGILPKEDEIICRPAPAGWGYWWVLISDLDQKQFKVDDVLYTCHVLHKPSQCNFWHFELRFYGPNGQDVNDLGDNAKRKFAGKLRRELIQVANSEAEQPPLILWPTSMFSTAS